METDTQREGTDCESNAIEFLPIADLAVWGEEVDVLGLHRVVRRVLSSQRRVEVRTHAGPHSRESGTPTFFFLASSGSSSSRDMSRITDSMCDSCASMNTCSRTTQHNTKPLEATE